MPLRVICTNFKTNQIILIIIQTNIDETIAIPQSKVKGACLGTLENFIFHPQMTCLTFLPGDSPNKVHKIFHKNQLPTHILLGHERPSLVECHPLGHRYLPEPPSPPQGVGKTHPSLHPISVPVPPFEWVFFLAHLSMQV